MVANLDRASSPNPIVRPSQAHATLGLVGCGKWGKNILDRLVQKGVDVHVVAPSATTQHLAYEAGAKSVSAHTSGMPEVQGIVVASPASVHTDNIIDLSSRKVPFFVVKPLATNLSDANRIVRSVQSGIFVLEVWRYHQAVRALKTCIQTNECGRLQGLQLTRRDDAGSDPDVDAIFSLTPHDLAIAHTLLERYPDPRAIVSHLDGEDISGLIAIMGSDPWCIIDTSTRSERRIREMRAYFDHGVVYYSSDQEGFVTVRRTSGQVEVRKLPDEEPLSLQLDAVLNYIVGNSESLRDPCGKDAADTVERLGQLQSMATSSARELKNARVE